MSGCDKDEIYMDEINLTGGCDLIISVGTRTVPDVGQFCVLNLCLATEQEFTSQDYDLDSVDQLKELRDHLSKAIQILER